MSIESMVLTISSSVTPFSFCFQSFPTSESCPVSWLFALGGQSIEASTSATVLPMNIQGWFPLGLTGLISLQCPRDSQESSPALQFKNINSSAFSLLYGPTLTSVHDYWKNYSFDYTDLCQQSDELFLLIAIQLGREWTYPEFHLCFRALCEALGPIYLI